MAPLEVQNPSTPSSTSPSSSSAATGDSSESSDDNSAPVVSHTRCPTPGRRRIGGRIYDSILGVTCHWCRQKTVEDHVFCCHCNIAFCGGCLRNRHGEDIKIEMRDDVQWTCPKCRGGCGCGCKNCCNCGPCRKAQGLEPTGLLVHTARACGFTNVHDYLIHQKTGESEETIAKRKQGKEWCWTNPSVFQKKQKRIKDERGVEATCRKRLNFTSSDRDSQEKRRGNSPQSNAVKICEPNSASNMSKDEKLSQACSLQSKDGSHKESKSLVLRSPSENSAIVQPKPEPNLHIHKEPCQKRTVSSFGKVPNVQRHFQANTVQPKPEPDLYVPEEPMNMAAMPSLRDGTAVQLHSQCDVEMRPQRSSHQNPSGQTNEILHAEDELIAHGRVSQQFVIVGKEPCEPDSHPVHGASSNVFGTSTKVKTEEVPWCTETSSLDLSIKGRQVKKETLDQPDQSTEVLNVQLMCVKVEPQDQCLQDSCDNVSTNKFNVFSAAFSRGEGDAAWCGFKEDFKVPCENAEGSPSRANKTGEASSSTSPSASNFHLYPDNLLCVCSHVKKEVVNGQPVSRSDVEVKLEDMNSQEAQCNSTPGRPVTRVKEEQVEVWNEHCPSPGAKSTMSASYTNSLLGVVQGNTEQKCCSFTIEPFVCPSTSMIERLPLRQVKEEVIVDIPMPQVIRIDDDETVAVSVKDKPEISAGLKNSSSYGAVSHLWKVDDFRNKLEVKLAEPFCRKELEELAAAASLRKPIHKVRETRQGYFEFVSKEEGFSYLDHHPDLDIQLKEAISPIARLSLLRGFFFWLEHASTLGAFKPWTSVSRSPEEQENNDCVEIEGLDCEILAVVCSVDKEMSGVKWSKMRKSSAIVL